MSLFAFETVDVFTDRQFGGNPLAVFPDARGLETRQMQALAAEFNLSETAFVLPAAEPGKSARVRIFNRTAEMAFAGHPSIGTAYVLPRHGRAPDGSSGWRFLPEWCRSCSSSMPLESRWARRSRLPNP